MNYVCTALDLGTCCVSGWVCFVIVGYFAYLRVLDVHLVHSSSKSTDHQHKYCISLWLYGDRRQGEM